MADGYHRRSRKCDRIPCVWVRLVSENRNQLVAQVVVVTLFVVFVVFRLMGRDYDAAVMSAGYAGLALRATPTAIANMTAVTEKFGASAQAFVVVPLVGAFFIDISNALLIQFLLDLI